MRKPPLAMLLAGGILAVGSSAFANGLHEARPASPQVVYGRDDRIEYFAAPTRVQHAADAVCVVVERGELVPNGDGTVTLLTVPYANQFNPPLCDDEPFRSQSTIGECTGYLVAPDLVVTAGHCVEPDELADVAFVFGFSLTDPGQLTPAVVPEADVYYARAILGHSFHDAPDYSDYTVIRLDRVAAGRDPLAIRRTGTPVVSDPVVLIGYPYGLPLKVAGGAEVKRVTRTFFEANTDSYAANSGSPVVDSTSLV
ncbi:MAG: trypsin-like serine peptidase, partial [Gaiellaceae bacterium]